MIELPIAIGLVGAPSSGKAPTAEIFSEISKPFFEELDAELAVLENAGTLLEREFDKAFGLFAEPSDTLWAFFNRHEREMNLRLASKTFISVGTTFDHLAHAGIYVENQMTGLQTEIQQVRLQRAQLALADLTYMHLEKRRYNFEFYLPHAGSDVIIPGSDDLEANYNARVDRNLRRIIANFGVRIQMVEGTPEEKAQTILDTITKVFEQDASEEESVLPSGDETTVSS